MLTVKHQHFINMFAIKVQNSNLAINKTHINTKSSWLKGGWLKIIKILVIMLKIFNFE